jgi:hypothetical protein
MYAHPLGVGVGVLSIILLWEEATALYGRLGAQSAYYTIDCGMCVLYNASAHMPSPVFLDLLLSLFLSSSLFCHPKVRSQFLGAFAHV